MGGQILILVPLEVITCTYSINFDIHFKNYQKNPQNYKPVACGGGFPEAACLFSENHKLSLDNGKTEKWYANAGTSSSPCASSPDPESCYNSNLPTDLWTPTACAQVNPGVVTSTVKGSTKSLVIVNKNRQIDIHKTVANMGREIYYKGPIIGKYAVYGDFTTYSTGEYANNPWPKTNGIYIHSKSNSPYKGDGTMICPPNDSKGCANAT